MFKNLFNKNAQVMTDTVEVEAEVYSTQEEVLDINTEEINFDSEIITEEIEAEEIITEEIITEEIIIEEIEAKEIEIEEIEADEINPEEINFDSEIITEEIEADEINSEEINFDSEIGIEDEIDANYLINAAEVVGWSSIEEQNTLFDALISYYTPSNSILDVGCGRADLFGFIKTKYSDTFIDYKGIDYNPNILNIATQKYPKVVVQPVDLMSIETDIKYDWVVGSGLFNLNDQADLGTYTSNCIDKMYEKCEIGVAFNLNTGNADNNDTMLISWNAGDWLGYLISKYGKVICRADYLETDVTFFIFK